MTEPAPDTLYCANHPDRETLLRCNRCGKPICTQCAIKTPVGYRCKECVRGQQKVFETATRMDVPLAFLTAGVLSWLGSYSAVLGFFTIFVSPIIGVLIAMAVNWVTRRRRSPILFKAAAIAAGLGSLPRVVTSLLTIIFALSNGYPLSFGYFLPLIWQGVYTFFVVSTLYYRLSGIQIR